MSDIKLFNLPRITFGSVLLAVITVVSSALSAYCGWMLAHGTNVVIQVASAGAGGTIALLLAINTTRAAHAYRADNEAAYRSLMRYCLLLAVFNWVTDFGAASVLRDASFISSENVNIAAKQKLGEVKRIESRIASIQSDLVQYKATKTPGFYQAELLKLKSTLGSDGRNIWQRSHQCADVTIPESRDHCADIAAADQGVADAKRKRALEDERLVLTQQLPAAKLASQQTTRESNPVIAQIGNFLAFALQTFQHTNGQIKWGILVFTLCWTMIFSVIIFRESWGAAMVAPAQDTPWARNEWLPDERPEARRETAEGQSSISLNTTVFADDNMEVLKRAVQRAKEMAA